LVGSATVGKIMGARLAAADIAEEAQQRRFRQIADEVLRALEQLPLMVGPAIAAIKVHSGLTEDQIRSQLSEWSSKGVSVEDTNLLSQALGEDAASKLVKFLSDPSTAKQMRPLTEIVTGMAPVVAKAAGQGLQELTSLLAITSKVNR
jgi:glycerol-3-phosphate dehydrogenase